MTDTNPRTAFRDFLDESVAQGWIASWTWDPARRAGLDCAFSKSHKTEDSGQVYVIEVESAPQSRSGVDLEFFVPERPLFRHPGWLERRLKIPQATVSALSPHQLLEEWCFREAAFKALYPHNAGVVLSDFERTGPQELRCRCGDSEHVFQLRGAWRGSWFLALARRHT